MNSLFREYFPATEPEGPFKSLAPYFTEYQAMRDQLMEVLAAVGIPARSAPASAPNSMESTTKASAGSLASSASRSWLTPAPHYSSRMYLASKPLPR